MLALVGEKWGSAEKSASRPFSGHAGAQLRECLHVAGISPSEVHLTNVVNRPCDESLYTDIPYVEPPVSPGKYLRPNFAPDVEHLYAELDELRPTCVVAMGGLAAWALLCVPSPIIGKLAGSVIRPEMRPYPVVVTYNPAAILYDKPHLKVDIVAALKMARGTPSEVQFDVQEWKGGPIAVGEGEPLAVDIETRHKFPDMIGFGTSKRAYVWTLISEEGDVLYTDEQLEEFKKLLEGHPLIFHNGGGFDVPYLKRTLGLDLSSGYRFDTRVLGRVFDPENTQGLKALGPRHLGIANWSIDHSEEEKRDG